MTRLSYNIHCKYSGLLIGKLEYEVVAGHMPYLSHWNGMVALHPIFSLDQHRLLAFSRSEWNRLAKLSADNEATEAEQNILQVCFLALLHSLGGIQQEAPSLPPMHLVQTHMNRLFVLAHWHHYLDSKRFRFPEFKINKLNANGRFENIGYYLDACFSVKEDYENNVQEMVEKEKVIAAERAMMALRNSWITPVGKKQLWRWVVAHLPQKFQADAQGWMGTIFLGNEKTILDFDKDEIELLTEIIVSECPNGTGILKAVRDRLDQIMQIYVDNKEAFTVDFSSYEVQQSAPSDLGQPQPTLLQAPKPSDFPTKVAYIKANALFYLQQRAMQQRTETSKAGAL